MNNDIINSDAEKLGFLNLLIVALSIYVLIAIIVDTLIKLPFQVRQGINALCFPQQGAGHDDRSNNNHFAGGYLCIHLNIDG